MNDRLADLERVVLASQRPEGAWAAMLPVPPRVRFGSCVTSITGPNGGAELYER